MTVERNSCGSSSIQDQIVLGSQGESYNYIFDNPKIPVFPRLYGVMVSTSDSDSGDSSSIPGTTFLFCIASLFFCLLMPQHSSWKTEWFFDG
jgi:hypothetical protein